MGLKQFTKDVSNVQHMYFEGVTGIRRGDSDGELVFCYSHNELQTPLEIQILFLGITFLNTPCLTEEPNLILRRHRIVSQ